MAKKGPARSRSPNPDEAQASAQLSAKDLRIAELEQQLEQAQVQAERLQQDVGSASDARVASALEELLRSQQHTGIHHHDYETRVLELELQNMVERYRTLDVDVLSTELHELRSEVLRLNQENYQLTSALASRGEEARRDVARIQLALEAAARGALSTARDRICRELHEQLDESTKALVEEHGALQESTLVLSQQAAALDHQYRTTSMGLRQYKIDAEVGKSMNDMLSRQAVLLKHQLERVNLALQIVKARCEEESKRADAAETRAAGAERTAAQLQHRLTRLHGLVGTHPSLPEDLAVLIRQHTTDTSISHITGESESAERLSQRLLDTQSQLTRCTAARDRWKDRSQLYERACAQLQAALVAMQHQSPSLSRVSSCADPSAIWGTHASSRPHSAAAPRTAKGALSPPSPHHRVTQDPSGVLADLSCLSGHTPRSVTPTPTDTPLRDSTTQPAPQDSYQTAEPHSSGGMLQGCDDCVSHTQQPAAAAAAGKAQRVWSAAPQRRPAGPAADARFRRPVSALPGAVMAHTLSHAYTRRPVSAAMRSHDHSTNRPTTPYNPYHSPTTHHDTRRPMSPVPAPHDTFPGVSSPPHSASHSVADGTTGVSRLTHHSDTSTGQLPGRIALQPRKQRPGSVRYFSGVVRDPFSVKSAQQLYGVSSGGELDTDDV